MAKQENIADLNIYQKLAKVRKACEVIQKNKSGYGYRYVSEDEILAKITGAMDKYGLSLFPSIVPNAAKVEPYSYKETKTTKSGEVFEKITNEVLVQADMVYVWINNDRPEERVEVPWFMVGQQSDASQGFGSGLTYSNRYFLLKFFSIATVEDDPDNFRSKQKKTEAEQDAIIAEEIISEVNRVVNEYLGKNPDDREAMLKLIKKYVKSGDYTKIKSSLLAAKLLEDINTTFITKE